MLMAFYLMVRSFDRAIILSGMGILPVLKFLRATGKDVLVLARGRRTARRFANSQG